MKKAKLFKGKLAVVLLSTILSFQYITAQELKVIPSESEVKVLGTSNLHDWELNAETFHGKGSFSIEGDRLISVNNLSFAVATESLKSGKNGMDKNTYKALKSQKFKEITFRSVQAAGIEEIAAGQYRIRIEGDLGIAGVSKKVLLMFTVSPGNGIHLSGKAEILMSDYNVEPPTALLGTVKTGEKVTVDLNITYK